MFIKQFLFLIALIAFSQRCFSQDGEYPLPYKPEPSKYDTAPYYKGGSDAMLKYFSDSVHYPETEKSKLIQGNVMAKFIVLKNGTITNVEIINGVPYGPNLAKEALRLLKNMPAWMPATKNGKPVDAEVFLSVPFIIK